MKPSENCTELKLHRNTSASTQDVTGAEYEAKVSPRSGQTDRPSHQVRSADIASSARERLENKYFWMSTHEDLEIKTTPHTDCSALQANKQKLGVVNK